MRDGGQPCHFIFQRALDSACVSYPHAITHPQPSPSLTWTLAIRLSHSHPPSSILHSEARAVFICKCSHTVTSSGFPNVESFSGFPIALWVKRQSLTMVHKTPPYLASEHPSSLLSLFRLQPHWPSSCSPTVPWASYHRALAHHFPYLECLSLLSVSLFPCPPPPTHIHSLTPPHPPALSSSVTSQGHPHAPV